MVVGKVCRLFRVRWRCRVSNGVMARCTLGKVNIWLIKVVRGPQFILGLGVPARV